MAHCPDREGERGPRAAPLESDRAANASSDGFEPSAATPASQAATGSAGAAPRGAAALVPAQTERATRAASLLPSRHMPREPRKFSIPRKTKEKKALLRHVSTTAREHDDMMNILTASYIDIGSAGCFGYFKLQVVYNEQLEKEFVEKRREMKADGRTEKELEESYCFLLTDAAKVQSLCENGLLVRHSWMTGLGDPAKGVYLSRYSDLIQVNPITPGASGEIVIFKVMKGKVKSISESMRSLLDPTPHFDSHVSTSASKVTSITSYRALEFTQQYFYEYAFDELRQRPRQVCPYGVVSFVFRRKDAPPTMPGLSVRAKSMSARGSTKRAWYTVWTGDLVKGDRVITQMSLRSYLTPFLPYKLPEKLEIGQLMRLEDLTNLLPSDLLSYSHYTKGCEVEKNGFYGSVLEVTESRWSKTLLNELETKGASIVTPLPDRGFLIFLSRAQMTRSTEERASTKRCLQALFVFPESRRVTKYTSRCKAPSSKASESMHGNSVMPDLDSFIPALSHALVKAKANTPPDLAAYVAHHAREYIIEQNESTVDQYPMEKYDTKRDEELLSPSRYHKANTDGYLKAYISNPASYQLPVTQARLIVETPVVNQDEFCTTQLQQLTDLVLSFQRNAKSELKKEREGGGAMQVMTSGWKRHLEPEAERMLKVQKMSQNIRSHSKIPGAVQPAGASGNHSEVDESGQGELSHFENLLRSMKLDLDTSCAVDTKKLEQLEAADSVISSEGFSPSSHSGERAAWRAGGYEDEEDEGEIPWLLIPITGVCSERYTQGDRNIPQDPRFQHHAVSTGTTNQHLWRSPTPPLDPSCPYSLSQCPSPKSHLPSSSPSQCLPPETSLPSSLAQCQAPDSLKSDMLDKELCDANKELLAATASRETSELNTEDKKVDCHSDIDDNDAATAAFDMESLALSLTTNPQIEAPSLAVQISTPPSVSSATALSSLMSLWQPETSRESVYFYLNSTKPKDLDFEALKEHLLSLGYVEQCPLEFLLNSDPEAKLLVLVHNKHIEEQIHEIPYLVQLKQRQSVKFLGVDSLHSLQNGSYKELFVSGGLIIPDDDVLNPDVITHDQLAALLIFLENQSSGKNMWNFKVHSRCHGKLETRARFCRDAANLVDLLSSFKKSHIVQFVSCDLCDDVKHQSSAQCSLKDLHECFTQYRHTVYLTEHPHDKFSALLKAGIVVTNIKDALHRIKTLIGIPDIKDLQQIIEGVLSSEEHDHSLLSHGHNREPRPSPLPLSPSNRPCSSSGQQSCETSGSPERHPASQQELNSLQSAERASQGSEPRGAHSAERASQGSGPCGAHSGDRTSEDLQPHGAHSVERHPTESQQNSRQVHSVERTSQDSRGHHSAREFLASQNESQAHRPRGAHSAERFSGGRQKRHPVRSTERESHRYRPRGGQFERFSASHQEHHPVHSEWESQDYRHHSAEGVPSSRHRHHLDHFDEWESHGCRPRGDYSAERFSSSRQEHHPSHFERESQGYRPHGTHSAERFSGSCHELHLSHFEREPLGPRPHGTHSAARFLGCRQEFHPSRSAERASPGPRPHRDRSAERFLGCPQDLHPSRSTERGPWGPRPHIAPSSGRYLGSRHEPYPFHSAGRASPDPWHRVTQSSEWYPASPQERYPDHSAGRLSPGPWHHGAHSQERYPTTREERYPENADERALLGLIRSFRSGNDANNQSRHHRAQSPVGPHLLRGFSPRRSLRSMRSMHHRAPAPEDPPC